MLALAGGIKTHSGVKDELACRGFVCRIFVRITPAMVTLWKRGQEILATKAEQKWEEEGGRRREFLDLAVELHELLDRRPWEVDVFYVDAMKPSNDQDQGDWVDAAAARRALVTALQQQSG